MLDGTRESTDSGHSLPAASSGQCDHATTKPWKAILPASVRDAVVSIARDLADQLGLSSDAEWTPRTHGLPSDTRDSAIGLTLMLSYLSRIDHDDRYIPGMLRGLRHLAEVDPSSGLGMHSGITSAAWVTTHVKRHHPDLSIEDPTSELPGFLGALLDGNEFKGSVDFMHGLVGVGAYLLDQPQSPDATAAIENVIDHLDRLAVRSSQGISWRMAHRPVEPSDRNYRRGLGMAHGVAGVVTFLARAHSAGMEHPRILPMLSEAVSVLINEKAPLLRREERTLWSWCWGDPGIAFALFAAGRGTGNEDWKAFALNFAEELAAVDVQSATMPDSCLCHGHAGVGHVFNRLYQASRVPQLEHASRRYLLATLENRTKDESLCGFRFVVANSHESPRLGGRTGLLWGASGAVLALLAAASDVSPDWDALLSLTLPFTGSSA